MVDEVTPEIISLTQKSLGKYVTKPPLTEKLLKKPPFRFLYDVVNTVVRETGFLKGLFSEAELFSDNVKDRDGKLAFLNKLIVAVKTISGEDLPVRASKIIAGLEPAETNKLLQTIGNCIKNKVDSKEYVTQLRKAKKTEKLKKASSKTSEKSKDSTGKAKNNPAETPKIGDKVKSKVKEATPRSKPGDITPRSKPGDITPKVSRSKEVVKKASNLKQKESPRSQMKTKNEAGKSPNEISKKLAELQADKEEIQIEENVIGAEKAVEKEVSKTVEEEKKVHMERPKSARPRTAEIRKDTVEEKKKGADDKTDEEQKVEEKKKQVEEEKKKQVEEEEVKIPHESKIEEAKPPQEKKIEALREVRPRSSLLRPPSVRPSSARPGAPRLRPDSSLPGRGEIVPMGKINVIVENFDGAEKEQDEEETVVVENVEELVEPVDFEKSLDIPADKGHLVEQILEEIKGKEDLEEHVKENVEWEKENVRGRDTTSKEINQLRGSIQSLTRTANPLGKLMSYLHEDVEAMHSELDTWLKMKRQFLMEIDKQKRVNQESNQPLILQLAELEENIRHQREEIQAEKFQILKNEEKIRDLISKQVAVQ